MRAVSRFNRYRTLISEAIKLAVPMTPAERRRTYIAFFMLAYLVTAVAIQIAVLGRFIMANQIGGLILLAVTILLCGVLAVRTVDRLLQRERK